MIRQTRAELRAHIGGDPSATQRALIEQLVQIKLRLAVTDRKLCQTGLQTNHDSRTYLAWANAYARSPRQLDMEGVKRRRPTLADHFAARTAQATAGGDAA